MKGESADARGLLFLTFRDNDVVAEVAHMTRTFFWQLVAVHDFDQLQRQLRRGAHKVVLVDLRDALPYFIAKLPQVARQYPSVQWVGLVEGHVAENPAHAAFLHSYFFDFCFSPIQPLRLTFSLGHAWSMALMADIHMGGEALSLQDAHGLLGSSAGMRAVREQLRRYAGNDLPVLITGPTGTGKELAAGLLHRHSARCDGPFVAVNCGALTPSLVQSELFGHEKGAFTGANKRKIGRIEAADGGTLLLDEVGDLPHDTQVSLLRFLQEGKIDRVGGVDSIPVNVRVIAATHINLDRAVRDGGFREDLYFRLNVLRVQVPSLSERDHDVVELAQHYLNQFAAELKAGHKAFDPSAQAALLAHDWPGNIRELMNRLRRAIVLSNSHTITAADLELAAARPVETRTLDAARDEAERQAISRSLIQTGHNVTEAAHLLGVSRVTLHRLIKKHRLMPS